MSVSQNKPYNGDPDNSFVARKLALVRQAQDTLLKS
jgi:hypothetical protein